MNLYLLYLLIGIQFLAIILCFSNTEYKRSICYAEWDQHFLSLIAKASKEYASVYSSSDDEHSIGYHIRRSDCEQISPQVSPFFPKHLTTYLSDKDLFLYLYVSLSSIYDNSTTFRIGVNKYPSEEAKFLLVIWLESTPLHITDKIVNDSAHHINELAYSLSLPNIKQSTHISINAFEKQSQQIMIKNRLFSRQQNPNIEVIIKSIGTQNITESDKTAFQIKIDKTYAIFCAKRAHNSSEKYSTQHCEPKLTEFHVTCQCVRYFNNLVPMIIVILFWTAIVTTLFLLYSNIHKIAKTKHQFTANFVKAISLKYSYHYLVILRFSKAQQIIDLETTKILIEFHSKNSLGPVESLTASLAKLKNNHKTDIPIHVFRLEKLPQDMCEIHCQHNSDNLYAKFFLYGIGIIDCSTKLHVAIDQSFNYYSVHDYVEKNMRTLSTTLLDESDINQLRANAINIDYDLSPLEVTWILFVMFSVQAFLCFLFPLPIYRYNFIDTAISVFVAVVIGGIVGAIFITAFRLLIVNELKDKLLKINYKAGTAFYTKICFQITTSLVAVLFGVIMAWFGQLQFVIETFYWFCATVCSCLVFASLWLTLTHFSLMQKLPLPTDEEFYEQTATKTELN